MCLILIFICRVQMGCGLPDAHLPPVGSYKVGEAFGQPLHLSVAVECDARFGFSVFHVQHHMVIFVVFCYCHS